MLEKEAPVVIVGIGIVGVSPCTRDTLGFHSVEVAQAGAMRVCMVESIISMSDKGALIEMEIRGEICIW